MKFCLNKMMLSPTPTQYYLVRIRLQRIISFVTSFKISKWLKKYYFMLRFFFIRSAPKHNYPISTPLRKIFKTKTIAVLLAKQNSDASGHHLNKQEQNISMHGKFIIKLLLNFNKRSFNINFYTDFVLLFIIHSS